jgi:RimJ/RimL family protein N-acetyltransferase
MMQIKQWLAQENTPVTIRPLGTGDITLVQELYQHVSLDSLYYRYFSPYRPTMAELHQLCGLGDTGAGYLAVIERPSPVAIGVAHYVIVPRQSPKVAEPAFLVADRFQGQGVGQMLFQAMSRHAVMQGIHTFTAYVHPANDAMIRLFRRSGLPVDVRMAEGVRQVQCILQERALVAGGVAHAAPAAFLNAA